MKAIIAAAAIAAATAITGCGGSAPAPHWCAAASHAQLTGAEPQPVQHAITQVIIYRGRVTGDLAGAQGLADLKAEQRWLKTALRLIRQAGCPS